MTPDGKQAETRKNLGGRPRVAEPRTAVSTWLPVGTAERLYTAARAEDISVSELVRRIVVLRLK